MMSTRVGCKVLLAPQKTEGNTGEIVDMAVQSPDTKPLVKVAVRNPGSSIYRARGTAKIKNAAGETVAKAPLIPAQLLPGIPVISTLLYLNFSRLGITAWRLRLMLETPP